MLLVRSGSNTRLAWVSCFNLTERRRCAGVAKAPDGSFWVAHRGDRVRDSVDDETDGAGGIMRVPKAVAQSEALAPVLGPTLLRIEADTGRVLQAWLVQANSCGLFFNDRLLHTACTQLAHSLHT